MSVSPGYRAVVRIAATPTAHTAEAFTNSDGGSYLQYKITATARRILWLASGLTVKVNGSAVAAADYTVDPLFGRVTFLVALLNTDTVTADTHYLPTTAIAYAKAFSMKVSATPADATSFGSAGWKTPIPTLGDAEGTLDLVEPTSHAFVSTTSFDTLTDRVTVFVVELQPDSTRHEIWRCYVLASSAESKAAVAGIAEGSLAWMSAPPHDVLPRLGAATSFGWGVDN